MTANRTIIFTCSILFFSGCASFPGLKSPSGVSTTSTERYAATPNLQQTVPTDINGQDDYSVSPITLQDENQRLLDSAIDFYEIAKAFWERGDLESALNALDESYALILAVNQDADQTLLQQKEDLRFTIAKRIMEVYASRFSVVTGNQNAIPLVMNKHVEKAIKSFTGSEGKFFINSYIKSGKYRAAIVEGLKEEGLPEELSWLPLIESGFRTRALSRARALGMWQFIASTGYKFGLERDAWIDERMDPEKSTRAAIAYLKELHGIFGDWTTALAAYNCGEGTILRVIKRQKIRYLDNFWDLYTYLPRETASYVPRFMAVLHIINDPERYGITLPPLDAPLAVDQVMVEKQVALKSVAKTIGSSYEEMKDLNPELRRNVTPKTSYLLKVPSGKKEILLAKLPAIPTWVAPTPSYVVHRVRRGESLSVIATRYGTSVRAIMAMNGLKRSSYIKQGWKLKVPTSKLSYRKKPSIVQTAHLNGDSSAYVVRKGDSLWKIANRFGTTTKALQSINQLPSTRLDVGQILAIPKSRAGAGS
jgi:membrane-bound lytic murein transglycosylase D